MRFWSLLVLPLFLIASLSRANVLGDFQTFAPNTDGLDFVTVHTSRGLTKGFLSVGAHFSVAKDHFLVYRNLNTQERMDYKDKLAEFDFDFAFGMWKNFSLTFAAPSMIYYEPDDGQEFKARASTGTHTYRPGFKWTLFPKQLGFAILGSVDIPNVENSPFGGVDSQPIYNFELAKTFKGGGRNIYYGINAGYRIRSPDVAPSDARMFPLDDQILLSAARSAPFFSKSQWIFEIIGSTPAQKAPYKKAMDASSLEILLGAKHRLTKSLNLDYGATYEPLVESMAPRYRAFIGMVYYFNTAAAPKTPPPPPLPEPEPEPPPPPVQIPPLVVQPESIEVVAGASINFQVSGGATPYSVTVKSGAGRLYPETYTYRTSLNPETAVIEVTDQSGQLKTVTVKAKAAPKPDQVIQLRNLNFEFATANLIRSSEVDIVQILGSMKEKKIKRVIIEGHTDSFGSDEYNIELSERRAQAIAAVLARELGLKPEMITSVGFGETKPMARNETAIGRQLNRRVDIKVYYVSK